MLYYLVMKTTFIFLKLCYSPFRLFRIFYKRQKLPPIDNKLLLTSATRLAKMVKNREVRSEEIVSAFIGRCREVNPILNAIVQDRFELALSEAKLVDSMIAEYISTGNNYLLNDLFEKKPLLGVPFTVKESIGVKGMSNSSGLVKGNEIIQKIAQDDAYVVKLLQEAGGIPIAVTNTPELCMNIESYNNMTGHTKNPYDTKRSPGGSSGGEAALISSGASVFGIGSDLGGSLRIPAHFTGIFSHKPTREMVSIVGHVPASSDPNWPNILQIGPLVRYAEDLKTVLKCMQNPNGVQIDLDSSVLMKDLKFFYMENDGGCNLVEKVHADLIEAIRKTVKYLEQAHSIKVKQAVLDLKQSFDLSVIQTYALDGIQSPFQKEPNSYKLKSVTPVLLKKLFGMSDLTLSTVVYGPSKKIFDKLFRRKLVKELEKIEELRKKFYNLLGNNGVFLYPSFTRPAFHRYESFSLLPGIGYTMIFNLLGFPVTNCPIFLNQDGLPIGLQIVTLPGNDRLSIAVAEELERAFGGWKNPSKQNI